MGAAREYDRLLFRLLRLISCGRGDSPEAEAVRDEMEGPWYKMTLAEQAGAREKSAARHPTESDL